MKIIEILERDEDPFRSSYQNRRKELISKITTTVGLENIKDANKIMTAAKSYLSHPPFSLWTEDMQRKMLHDVMDAFGITPDDRNVSRFMRY